MLPLLETQSPQIQVCYCCSFQSQPFWFQPLSLSEEFPGVPLLGLGAFTAEA